MLVVILRLFWGPRQSWTLSLVVLRNLMVAKCSCAKRPSWRCSKMKHDGDPEMLCPRNAGKVVSGQTTEWIVDRQSQKAIFRMAGFLLCRQEFSRFKNGRHSFLCLNPDRMGYAWSDGRFRGANLMQIIGLIFGWYGTQLAVGVGPDRGYWKSLCVGMAGCKIFFSSFKVCRIVIRSYTPVI